MTHYAIILIQVEQQTYISKPRTCKGFLALNADFYFFCDTPQCLILGGYFLANFIHVELNLGLLIFSFLCFGSSLEFTLGLDVYFGLNLYFMLRIWVLTLLENWPSLTLYVNPFFLRNYVNPLLPINKDNL